MPWEYKKAVAFLNTVAITLVNNDDPEEPQTRELTWTYDKAGTLTHDDFKAMVKKEIGIALDNINKTTIGEDVTKTYRPEQHGHQ